jgi:hypothetical protein
MSEFFVLRGERILQQLEEQSSVPDLETNIVRGFPNTTKRQHATGEVTISNVQYMPYLGMNMLHVKSTSSSNGHEYKQALQFNGVKFEGADTDQNATFQASDGEDYHVQPLELTGHNVKVRCSCLDFHYRFANYNSQDKSLVGRPPPLYQKKTNRPPVNPLQVPGMCKHLLKLVEMLQRYGLVKQG